MELCPLILNSYTSSLHFFFHRKEEIRSTFVRKFRPSGKGKPTDGMTSFEKTFDELNQKKMWYHSPNGFANTMGRRASRDAKAMSFLILCGDDPALSQDFTPGETLDRRHLEAMKRSYVRPEPVQTESGKKKEDDHNYDGHATLMKIALERVHPNDYE